MLVKYCSQICIFDLPPSLLKYLLSLSHSQQIFIPNVIYEKLPFSFTYVLHTINLNKNIIGSGWAITLPYIKQYPNLYVCMVIPMKCNESKIS